MKTELKCITLTDMLIAKGKEEEKGITFITSGNEQFYSTYAAFFKQVKCFLAHLQNNYGLHKGSQVIIYEEDNYRFLRCFWACVIGGMIPVPLAVGGKDEHKAKFFKIWQNQNDALVFTNTKNFERLTEFGANSNFANEAKEMHSRFIDSGINPDVSKEADPVESNPQNIGFIQYSSGSTGSPKGVVLTHENLIYNVHDIVGRSGLVDSDVFINWIPLTHDLGMIGFHLSCTLTGCSQYVMSTQLFIRRPILWMEKTHELKATMLNSPNFGYQYFLQAFNHLREEKQWDLSSVRAIFNGAEPISASLCRDFVETLGAFGMPENCITPCYGLAEACVGVTICNFKDSLQEYFIERNSLVIGGKAEFSTTYSKDKTVSLVGAGKTFPNCYVRIMGHEGQKLENGYVGHIQIQGKNVTKEYFNDPVKTQETMTADGWLKTGDLGLLLEDDSLVITGRHKNMIILQGQNYYAHDIESLLHDIDDISLGKVVACGVAGNSREKETLLVFVLFKKPCLKFIPVIREVEQKLSAFLDIVPDHVIPVREIPKTTSGKIQHNVLLTRFQQGGFNTVISEIQQVTLQMFKDEWQKLEENARVLAIKDWLLNQCVLLTGSNKKIINAEKPLADQGFKSVHAVQLSRSLQNQLALSTNDTLLYKYPSVNQLAIWINDQLFPSSEVNENIPSKIVAQTDEKILDELEAMSDDEIATLLLNDEAL
jgi:acyl-CoA synthetase (AMP-forming)/AMP-acid ligase II/acyl carrier protein